MTISKIVEWKTQSRKTRKVAIEHTAEATDRTAYLDGDSQRMAPETTDYTHVSITLDGKKEAEFVGNLRETKNVSADHSDLIAVNNLLLVTPEIWNQLRIAQEAAKTEARNDEAYLDIKSTEMAIAEKNQIVAAEYDKHDAAVDNMMTIGGTTY